MNYTRAILQTNFSSLSLSPCPVRPLTQTRFNPSPGGTEHSWCKAVPTLSNPRPLHLIILTLPTTYRHPPTFNAQHRITIAVDLFDKSAHAIKWVVQNYLCSGDAVILLHVHPTSVLYGADWGAMDPTAITQVPDVTSIEVQAHQKLEDEFDNFTTNKATKVAQPLVEGNIPFKIYIVKGEALFGGGKISIERSDYGEPWVWRVEKEGKGRLEIVSDYRVHHCVCPVVVVRYPEENDGDSSGSGVSVSYSTVCFSL